MTSQVRKVMPFPLEGTSKLTSAVTAGKNQKKINAERKKPFSLLLPRGSSCLPPLLFSLSSLPFPAFPLSQPSSPPPPSLLRPSPFPLSGNQRPLRGLASSLISSVATFVLAAPDLTLS